MIRRNQNQSPSASRSLGLLLFAVVLFRQTASANSDPRLYYFAESSKFDFIIYNFDQNYAPISQAAIDPPSGTSTSRTTSYSVSGKTYLTMSLPSSALSVSVTFGRSCVLPLLASAAGTSPSVTYVTTNPQEFYITAGQCGAPGIASTTRNNMGSINPFGYNTYNPVHTDFFQQSIVFQNNPNGYPLNVVLYCPYYQQSGGSSFDFKITVTYGQSLTATASAYDDKGVLLASEQTMTVGPGQTLSFAVYSTETALRFPSSSIINSWATYTTSSSSSINGDGISVGGRRLAGLREREPHGRLLTVTTTINATTSASGVSSFSFPTGFSSAQVYFQNTDKSNTRTVTVSFTSIQQTTFISTKYIVIIAVCAAVLVALTILIPVIVVRARRQTGPRIIYEQRTFVVSDRVIMQDVRLLNSRQMNTSGFKVKEIGDNEWEFLQNNAQEIQRADAPEPEELSAPVVPVYTIDLQPRGRMTQERNILANYTERTI